MTNSLIQNNHLQKEKTLDKKQTHPCRQQFTFLAFNIPQQSYYNKVKDLVYPNSLKLEHFQKVFVAKKG